MTIIRKIPIDQIQLDPRNPRTDGSQQIEELAASLRGAGMIQPPILVRNGGAYRILVGERRVRAAKLAGQKTLDCIISDLRDPLHAHRARVVENLHRQPLNPIDHAVSLRVAWLLANAEALGLRKEAVAWMSQEKPPGEIQTGLEAMLAEAGFAPTAPLVTWDAVLDELGIEMSAARRKKLINVLSLPRDVQERLRQMPITEAGARALASLDEEAQRKVVDAIADAPHLVRRARRIARAIRAQGYTVEEALAEARGEFIEAPPPKQHPVVFENDTAVIDAIMRFLDAGNQMLSALAEVRRAAPGVLDIPDPWRGYFENTLETIRDEIE